METTISGLGGSGGLKHLRLAPNPTVLEHLFAAFIPELQEAGA